MVHKGKHFLFRNLFSCFKIGHCERKMKIITKINIYFTLGIFFYPNLIQLILSHYAYIYIYM